MEVSICRERKQTCDLRAFSVKTCDALNARIDKDVQCAATYLNICRSKFAVAACHGYHFIINSIKLMSWEHSHYPILALDSILGFDEWWDGNIDFAVRKRPKKYDVSKGPIKSTVKYLLR